MRSWAGWCPAEAARAARIEVSFAQYARVGVPLTLLTLLVGWGVLIATPV